MSKRSCCCDGESYIAIPCRYASVKSFIQRPGIPPDPGGFDPGVPGQSLFWVFRENGSNLGEVTGPFRIQNGTAVFDTTREVVYMLRGAGGGVAGPYLPELDNNKRYGLGGNGAYTEYQKTADIADVVRPGQGGRGGQTYSFGTPQGDIKKTGGKSFPPTGQGGDAAVLMTESVSQTSSCFDPSLAVAGAGGGGGFVLRPSNVRGVRQGGNAGINLAETGGPGYLDFNNQEILGGGGATDLRGGTVLGGSLPDPTGTRARDGTLCSGGQGSLINDGMGGAYGYGGGGGGGLFGGAGGAAGGGGGGGSSTNAITTRGNSYSFAPKNDLPANYCNPYMQPDSGVGGRKIPINNSETGKDGEVVAYYILGYCDCDPSKNELPDPLFICLNKEQYDYIIAEAGTPSGGGAGGFGCQLLFVYNSETYILIGSCADTCEPIYQIPGEASFSEIRWACTQNPNQGGGGGEIIPSSGPGCCDQIICRPVCPIIGANCARCGCVDTNEVLVCCDTVGKPDQYQAVYNGWVYSCQKSNNNWIIPGSVVSTKKQCLQPNPDAECNPTPISCDATISEENNACTSTTFDNCDYSFTVSAPNTTISTYCVPGDEINGPCRPVSTNHTVNFDGFGGFFFGDDFCNGNQFSYTMQAEFSFITTRIEVEEVLRIEFDCVPPLNGFGAYPVDLPLLACGVGQWQICDATVIVEGGAFLSTLAAAFNVRLGGRVIVSDLTGGKFYMGTNFPDCFENLEFVIEDERLIVKIYGRHSYVTACGTASYTRTSFCGGISKLTLFEGNEVDAWDIPGSLGLRACGCADVPGGSIYNCQNCSDAEIPDVPCGNLRITG